MKILLIAYEFPPSPSPQSLRWTYLTRELARMGHEIHVLTPDLGPELGKTNLVDSRVVVHRTYAGPMRGFVAWSRRRRARIVAPHAREDDAGDGEIAFSAARRSTRSALKIRLVNAAYRISEWIWFPDIRGEWRMFAAAAVKRLLNDHRFDAVISSHEPATCLQLGLKARTVAKLPWIADLGDPVLAPYTPRRWKRRSARLERVTCHEANAVTVTAESAAQLLRRRHGSNKPVEVLTQGFGERPKESIPTALGTLELAYAGSFYNFRRAEALFEAVAETPGVRLSVATVSLPSSLREIATAHPGSFRLLGFLDHADALDLQTKAHVLVNIANRDGAQVPGKLYEYLGASRPILHLTQGGRDPGAELVLGLRRGWVVEDDSTAIANLLTRLRENASAGQWLAEIDLSDAAVQQYSWAAIGKRLDDLLRRTVETHQALRACSTPGNAASFPSKPDNCP